MSDKILRRASFDPKVKTYWLTSWIIVACITIFGIITIPIIFVLGHIIGQKVLDAMSAELSERKLFVKRGIFVKVEKSIPLEKITDVGMTQGPIMRLFGLYGLTFETAGQSSNGPLVAMVGIEDAAGFREAILTQKDNLASQSSTPATTNQQDISAEHQTLIELTKSVQRIEMTLAKLAAQQLKNDEPKSQP